MLIKIFLVNFVTLVVLVKAAFSQMTALNAEISSLIRPNWEFESFWAIPRVGDTKPTVAISLLSEKNSVNVRCLDLEYFEIKKTFKPKAKLKREFLHKIMCKSINRAIKNTNGLERIVLKTGMREVGLRFDFLSGWIEIVRIPNPPQPDEGLHEQGGGLDLHQQDT
ncbi:hypothetical protein OA343_00540 [Paracoccaceae bacterium]|nr:hypothetical protein [Paracoccaceae bacterium]